nr:hypothetical protein [Tanacetum cinerariifolium]
MASLADKAILSGAENRPPMLEKDMYDSWRSIMEMYMLNRQHGRIILESVKHGPLLWPSVTEDGKMPPNELPHSEQQWLIFGGLCKEVSEILGESFK